MKIPKSVHRDKDLTALRMSVRALDKCTSRRMVRATLEFLWHRYITHAELKP